MVLRGDYPFVARISKFPTFTQSQPSITEALSDGLHLSNLTTSGLSNSAPSHHLVRENSKPETNCSTATDSHATPVEHEKTRLTGYRTGPPSFEHAAVPVLVIVVLLCFMSLSLSSSSFFASCPCSLNIPPRRATGSWGWRGLGNKNARSRVSGAYGERTTDDAVEGSGGKGESIGSPSGGGRGFSGNAMEVTTFEHAARFGDGEFPAWEKIGAVVRLSYGIGIYVAMTLVGRFLCSFTGIDSMGGFNVSFDAILEGLGYAAPPIMALLFILDDEVVKLSPHARAIRDVEDKELWSFFYGMSPWQFILIMAASSVGEELFYRAAIQGFLADVFLRSTDMIADARGLASLTGVLPPFVLFAQAFAAVITAVLTGSLYYVAASPRDPTYIVAPVLQSHSGQKDLKKLFSAWYEMRQLKKIYSPLLEGFLALYLGVEWIQTNNILAPILTHGIYSTVIHGHGLWKIHNHRRRLRQRIRLLKQGKNSASH